MSEPWVVDTNVGVTANNVPGEQPNPPHRPESVIACTKFLTDIRANGSIVIDDSWEILREYQAKMRSAGQPGPGDRYLKWVLVNKGNPERCHQVDITEISVPDQLDGFDPADRKFIRVALGCPAPRIAEATDGPMALL